MTDNQLPEDETFRILSRKPFNEVFDEWISTSESLDSRPLHKAFFSDRGWNWDEVVTMRKIHSVRG